MPIAKKDLKKVSYLKFEAIDERSIPLQPCYMGNSKWEAWVEAEDNLLPFAVVGMSDGCYFSKSPESKSDIRVNFIELIMKRAYYKDLVHFEKGIIEDINNLSASVEKINLFHTLWLKDKNLISHRFVTTELEYIFKVCRSLFDLLQEVISKIWSRFIYIDKKLKTKKLRATFSKMVLCNNQLSSVEEIEKRYLIPKSLADFYVRNGIFFNWLRSYRDKISHGGHNIEQLYLLEDGFAVSTEIQPFKDLPIWEYTELKPNKLGSVRALVAYAILNSLHALEDFSNVIESIMRLPPDIAPDYNVYITGQHLGILKELYEYGEGKEWAEHTKSNK